MARAVRYRLIDALPRDEPWLEALRRAVYQDLFRLTWGGWDEERHRRHFASCLERGGISIIEFEGNRVGMVQVDEAPDAIEVGEIQIEPSHQNRGIGTRVLVDIVAQAHARNQPVRLKVGLKNSGAVRLYERLGFHRIAKSETHEHLEWTPGRSPTP